MKKIALLFAACCLGSLVSYSQVPESWNQINYEDLTPDIMQSLNHEIEKMNLEFILFNFYQHSDENIYPVEFLRKGVDIKALGGLEFLMFEADGTIKERRYKFYSDELLISTPLELIMTMQEKTKNQELNYLTKVELKSGQTSYQAITADSTFVFNDRMEFINATATTTPQSHIID
ncbi:hypothetical protein N6H18_12460 [Reichenbachiella agarivorans]|uniref:Uncharacterized protein n=1 Tax=Reichenbachiella agarivorans TaxID=2979464 RepID=A0ABY6CKV8_9BACT|nr:hypothetical protein [Reichenbachiella agarivorans]UXP31161.1 hypothetical protein N6H18_12460 [Reichenbachiella agarivorans]